MNLVDYIIKNRGLQRGDEYHDSFVRFLSSEEILKNLGINPPYHVIEFEVKVSNNNSNKRCDLIILNHELSIIEAKVIRSSNQKTKTKRIKKNNKQLAYCYSFFKKKKINTRIRLIGAYKYVYENQFNFYDLPSSGLSLGSLEILQIPCL